MPAPTVELDQTPFVVTQLALEDVTVDTRAFLMQTAKKLADYVKSKSLWNALIQDISNAKKMKNQSNFCGKN